MDTKHLFCSPAAPAELNNQRNYIILHVDMNKTRVLRYPYSRIISSLYWSRVRVCDSCVQCYVDELGLMLELE
jgi:hypothetical protein